MEVQRNQDENKTEPKETIAPIMRERHNLYRNHQHWTTRRYKENNNLWDVLKTSLLSAFHREMIEMRSCFVFSSLLLGIFLSSNTTAPNLLVWLTGSASAKMSPIMDCDTWKHDRRRVISPNSRNSRISKHNDNTWKIPVLSGFC